MKNSKKLAIDFDGTIVDDGYPGIGKTKTFAFETLKKLQCLTLHKSQISTTLLVALSADVAKLEYFEITSAKKRGFERMYFQSFFSRFLPAESSLLQQIFVNLKNLRVIVFDEISQEIQIALRKIIGNDLIIAKNSLNTKNIV